MNRLRTSLFVFAMGIAQLLEGCLVAQKHYIGYYTVACENGARAQATNIALTLSQKLSRELVYVTNEEAGLQVILMDSRNVEPSKKIGIIVTHSDRRKDFSITFRKGEQGEDETVRMLKLEIEDVLRANGVKWFFKTTTWSFAG